MESDIWGVGAVLCQILTPDTPQGQPKPGIPQEQPNYWKERVERLQNPTQEGPVAIPRLLVHVVSECLSPSVHGRPSALQLLAVVMKSDTSSEGVERSESFWKVIATQADPELASSVVTHFVSKHLRLLDGQPIFSLLETTLIMSLAYKHCPNLITQCHRVLCNSLLKDEEGELVGSTAFHVIAWLHKKDDEIARLAFEDSGWPFTKALSRFALRKNEAGLLPSALAALQGKKDLCVCLTKIECVGEKGHFTQTS
jgi:serine/threonine protein kinase